MSLVVGVSLEQTGALRARRPPCDWCAAVRERLVPGVTGCTAVWSTGLASSSASATPIDEVVPQADPYTELRFGMSPPASAAPETYTGTMTVVGN